MKDETISEEVSDDESNSIFDESSQSFISSSSNSVSGLSQSISSRTDTELLRDI